MFVILLIVIALVVAVVSVAAEYIRNTKDTNGKPSTAAEEEAAEEEAAKEEAAKEEGGVTEPDTSPILDENIDDGLFARGGVDTREEDETEPVPLSSIGGGEWFEDKEPLIPPRVPTPPPPQEPPLPLSPYKIPDSRKKTLIEEELSYRMTYSGLLAQVDSLFDEDELRDDTLRKIADLKQAETEPKLKDYAVAVAHEMGGADAVGSEFLNAAGAEIDEIMSGYAPDVVPVTLDLAIYPDTGPVTSEIPLTPDMTINVISTYTTEDVKGVPEGYLYVCVVNENSRTAAAGGAASKLEGRNVSLVFINNLGYDVGVTRAYIRTDAAGSLKSVDDKTVDIVSVEDKTPYFLANGTKRTLAMITGFNKDRSSSRLHVPLLLSRIRPEAVKPF